MISTMLITIILRMCEGNENKAECESKMISCSIEELHVRNYTDRQVANRCWVKIYFGEL